MPDTPLLRVRFAREPDARTVFASGVWGGVTPNGLVSASFYFEEDPLPDTMNHTLTADGRVECELERFPRPSAALREVERRVQVTVLLQPEIARAVAAWLNEKADLLESGSP